MVKKHIKKAAKKIRAKIPKAPHHLTEHHTKPRLHPRDIKHSIAFIVGLILVISLLILIYPPGQGTNQESTLVSAKNPEASMNFRITPEEPVVGEELRVEVLIENAEDIYGYQFTANYDDDILRFERAEEGNFLGTTPQPFCVEETVISSGEGAMIKNLACTLIGKVPGKSGSGVVYELYFTVLKEGSTGISLTETMFLNHELVNTNIAGGATTIII